MRLTVIAPTNDPAVLDVVRDEASGWASPGTAIDVAGAPATAAIASRHDTALAVPDLLAAIAKAADSGSDGVLVSCAGDPAVHEARENVDIPVVGGFQPAALTALSLGERLGFITVLPSVVPMLRALIRAEGLTGRVGTIRTLGTDTLDVHDTAVLTGLIREQALEALHHDEADVIVLACTGFVGAAARVRRELADAGFDVPVVDPTGAAVLWLESLVRLGVRASRTTYHPPPTMTWRA
ncbi:aspartate/glutamate racemase family protein [Nocardiopsis sediminis]|uniref:Aspartate/glutamate racemase family protein n=1 Tax=Nocardiopsis sediminis TaxID=1778267 RepID=A0ABV8FQQ4_9ACTN